MAGLGRWWRAGALEPQRKEIYYRGAKNDTSAEPKFGKPTTLFADEYDFGLGVSMANYDVTPDGHFAMLRRGSNGGKLRVVVNWQEELKQRVPTR